jgi:cytochrome b
VAAAPRRVLVWPAWQRVLHGVMGAAVITALVTHEGGTVHEGAGYVALAAALLRALMGLLGPRTARFASFVRSPANTLHYAAQAWRGTEPRYLNHNPLGAWMVLALLAVTVSAASAGALTVTDRFWGYDWLITLHALASWAVLPLVVLHVLGVLHASKRHREHLVGSMLHGYKDALGSDGADLPPKP